MSDINLKEKAKHAEKKPAALGPDIDLGAYSNQAEDHEEISRLAGLSGPVKERASGWASMQKRHAGPGLFFRWTTRSSSLQHIRTVSKS